MMLEAYEAYGSYDTMAELVRDLVLNAARAAGRTVVPGRDGSEIDLEAPWRRAGIHELVSEAVGETVSIDTIDTVLRALADKHGVTLQDHWGKDEIVLELFEKLVEHTLIQPTFVCDYPESVRPLAKKHRSEPGLVEAWDLVINGVELAPAYSELNDPVIQRQRLVAQSELAAAGDPEAMDVDEDFLRALEFGMPPAGGIGMGVDRLVMLLMGIGIRSDPLSALQSGIVGRARCRGRNNLREHPAKPPKGSTRERGPWLGLCIEAPDLCLQEAGLTVVTSPVDTRR